MTSISKKSDAIKANAFSIAKSIADIFTEGWNNANAAKFAEPFAEDAQFVTVYGELLQSKIEITNGHQFILNNIFKGSKIIYTTIDANQIDINTIIAHISGDGLISDKHGKAIMSLVIIRKDKFWKVRLLQNTTVTDSPKHFLKIKPKKL